MKTKKSLNSNVQNWQKKLIFGLISIIMISFVVFTMNSCSKEVESVGTDTQLSEIQDPTTRVKAFKQMLKSQEEGNLESRSTFTAEEVIWNVEANINYTYGEAGLSYDDYATLTDTIDVPELGGPMPSTVVARVNDDVLDIVKCFYHNTGFPNKKLKLVDVFPVAGQNAIGVTIVVGSITGSVHPNYDNFQPGDNWDVVAGICDLSIYPNNGPNPVSDRSACGEISRKATWNVGPQNYQAGEWYSDQEIVSFTDWWYLNENDSEPGDWIMDYFMLYLEICDDTYYDENCYGTNKLVKWLIDYNEYTDKYVDAMCLEYVDLNYYLANAESYCRKYETILNKEFLHLKMWPVIYPRQDVRWKGWANYGIRHLDGSRIPLTLGDCDK